VTFTRKGFNYGEFKLAELHGFPDFRALIIGLFTTQLDITLVIVKFPI
jgi:hypothetical protein